jgi:hypothetical protein
VLLPSTTWARAQTSLLGASSQRQYLRVVGAPSDCLGLLNFRPPSTSWSEECARQVAGEKLARVASWGPVPEAGQEGGHLLGLSYLPFLLSSTSQYIIRITEGKDREVSHLLTESTPQPGKGQD